MLFKKIIKSLRLNSKRLFRRTPVLEMLSPVTPEAQRQQARVMNGMIASRLSEPQTSSASNTSRELPESPDRLATPVESPRKARNQKSGRERLKKDLDTSLSSKKSTATTSRLRTATGLEGESPAELFIKTPSEGTSTIEIGGDKVTVTEINGNDYWVEREVEKTTNQKT